MPNTPTTSPEPRDGADVRIFPPLVPLTVGLVGVGLSRLWPIVIDLGTMAPMIRTVGDVMMVLALAMVIWSLGVLHRSGQDAHPRKPTPVILERGPFRFSRNPIYLQMVLLCLGIALRRLDFWTLALTPLAAWVLHRFAILPEEAYLERKFGEAYLAYQRRVRRWL